MVGRINIRIRLSCYVFNKANEDGRNLRTGCRANGIQGRSGISSNKPLGISPTDSCPGPIAYLSSVGVATQVADVADIIALELSVAVQNSRHLFTSNSIVGTEASIAVAAHNTVGRRPGYRAGIPLTSGHISEIHGARGRPVLQAI